MSFELDVAGGAEVLKEISAALVVAVAEQVAAGAGPNAVVKTRVTDRARASVTVPADEQAVDGVLTRAAAAVGLEVVERKPRKSGGKARKRRGSGKTRRPRPKASPAEAAAAGDANEAWVAARRAQRAQRRAGR